jgi:hypothetical protein
MLNKVKRSATRRGGAWGKKKYSSYSFLISAIDGVSGQHRVTPRLCFTPGKKTPRCPLYKRLGWPQNRSRRRGMEKIFCPCRKSNPGSLCWIPTVNSQDLQADNSSASSTEAKEASNIQFIPKPPCRSASLLWHRNSTIQTSHWHFCTAHTTQ